MYSREESGITVGENAYSEITRVCSPYGKTAAVVGGRRAVKSAFGRLAFPNSEIKITAKIWPGSDCEYSAAEVLLDIDELKKADMLFAVGGGRSIDMGKYLGGVLKKPVFSFPTVMSCAAAVTPRCYMYRNGQSSAEYTAAPAHAFFDSRLLADADEKYLKRGVCRALAAAADGVFYSDMCDMSSKLALARLEICREALLECGRQALLDNRRHVVSEAFEKAVYAAGAFGAGIGSGLASCLSDKLSAFLNKDAASIAVLAALLYCGEADEYMREKRFFESIGVPTRMREYNISDETAKRLAEKLSDSEISENHLIKISGLRLGAIFNMIK